MSYERKKNRRETFIPQPVGSLIGSLTEMLNKPQTIDPVWRASEEDIIKAHGVKLKNTPLSSKFDEWLQKADWSEVERLMTTAIRKGYTPQDLNSFVHQWLQKQAAQGPVPTPPGYYDAGIDFRNQSQVMELLKAFMERLSKIEAAVGIKEKH